jgi:glycosyltransferase involved in cell wall biosynthesis
MNKSPFVSIIIPTYKRPDNIKLCLHHLLALNYPKNKFEIIIIDDGSNDDTERIIKDLSRINKKNKISYVYQNNSGPARARNNGIKRSRGEIIFFVDDDILVKPDFILRNLKWYEDKKVGGVGGNVFPKKLSWPDKYYIARYLDEFSNVQRFEEPESGKGLATSNCSYRAKVLKVLKGFDESFPLAAGEDIDLSRRAMEKGWILIKDPNIIAEHLRSETFKSIVKLKFKRMSGAVIDNRRKKEKESIYKFSRVISQWRNFKEANKKIFHKNTTLMDFAKFVYLTFALFISSVRGMKHFKKKLNYKKNTK